MLPETWYFKCKRKPDWNIREFKAPYCVRVGVHNDPLNLYYPVVKWATVRLMLTLKCILGLKSHIIDFANDFSQADIPSWGPFFIELDRYFNIDGVKYGFVIRLKKSYIVNPKPQSSGMKS